MKNLLDILDEQSAINFSGKINILGAKKELLGTISIYEGALVNARKNLKNTINNLFYFAFEDLEHSVEVSYIVEPEIISPAQRIFILSIEEFKKKLSHDFSEYQKIKKLRPPNSLKLIPSVSVLPTLENMQPAEFDLLKVISEYAKVSDIYFYSPYAPLATTKLLVSLRKKMAISVFAKN